MKGMTLVVKAIARIVGGFIFLYGCYIVLYGHLSPGGGFAGGAFIAAGLILAFDTDINTGRLKQLQGS